jgi:hypothetical protein
LKNFTTIFPFTQNVHLIKDLGQIGNFFAKQKGFNTKLVCYRDNKGYAHLTTEANHLQIEFIDNTGRRLFLEKGILKYLKHHSKDIDILNLYHLTKESIYYGLYYSYLNKKGKIYLKMDAYNDALKRSVVYSKKGFFQKFHQMMERRFLKKLSVISVENPEAFDLLLEQYPNLKNKAMLITNGVNDLFLQENFRTINAFEEKENVILSVGRIGAKDKNFELLLDAFVKTNLNDWKLVFVGPIENNFEDRVTKIIAKKPYLKGHIELNRRQKRAL